MNSYLVPGYTDRLKNPHPQGHRHKNFNFLDYIFGLDNDKNFLTLYTVVTQT